MYITNCIACFVCILYVCMIILELCDFLDKYIIVKSFTIEIIVNFQILLYTTQNIIIQNKFGIIKCQNA